jgi:hypothetical protein
MKELLLSIGSGVIGGILVLLFQKFWDKRDKHTENRKSLVVDNLRNKKILPKDILAYLEPGLSIEKAKEFLGIPDGEYCYDEPESNTDLIKPYIYFYNFQNASLKISSDNKLSVDSVTIFAREDHKQKIEVFPNHFDQRDRYILGVSVIDDDIIKNQNKHYDLSSGRERVFAIEAYYGRFGAYLDYAYFGTDYKNYETYFETNKIELLKGERIMGFCVSSSGFFPWISIYETR